MANPGKVKGDSRMDASACLFSPNGSKELVSVSQKSPACLQPIAQRILTSMSDMIAQKDYPCMPALQSFHQNDYLVGIYQGFDSGKNSAEMVQDLLYFRKKQKQSASMYASFWAIFPTATVQDETDFENQLWKQLSFLSAAGNQNSQWDPQFSSDPANPKFCFSLQGEALFVVGVSPVASRKGRRFPFPSLILNYYDQFTDLAKAGKYDSIVKLNRQREMRFSGSLNPMVEKYGDNQEAIQFSGKENPDDWKCPFRHDLQFQKENAV